MAIGGMTLGNERNTNVVRFWRHYVENKFQTERTGKPVGEEVDYIEIRGLGQDKTVVKRKVLVKDQVEYSREWDLYQRGLEQAADGIRIERWTDLNEDDIRRLKSYNIHTIEAMRDVSDAGLYEMGPWSRPLQQRAIRYFEQDAPKAAAANLAVQVDELRTENERLTTEVAQLKAHIEDLESDEGETKKRGPGRPRTKAA